MKVFIIIILCIALAGVLIQLYFILKERNQLKTNLDDLNSRLYALTEENANLQSEIEYFSYPENLEKELKSKFNYKKPGEEMMIIVP
jgi:cell division protein FtsL